MNVEEKVATLEALLARVRKNAAASATRRAPPAFFEAAPPAAPAPVAAPRSASDVAARAADAAKILEMFDDEPTARHDLTPRGRIVASAPGAAAPQGAAAVNGTASGHAHVALDEAPGPTPPPAPATEKAKPRLVALGPPIGAKKPEVPGGVKARDLTPAPATEPAAVPASSSRTSAPELTPGPAATRAAPAAGRSKIEASPPQAAPAAKTPPQPAPVAKAPPPVVPVAKTPPAGAHRPGLPAPAPPARSTPLPRPEVTAAPSAERVSESRSAPPPAASAAASPVPAAAPRSAVGVAKAEAEKRTLAGVGGEVVEALKAALAPVEPRGVPPKQDGEKRTLAGVGSEVAEALNAALAPAEPTTVTVKQDAEKRTLIGVGSEVTDALKEALSQAQSKLAPPRSAAELRPAAEARLAAARPAEARVAEAKPGEPRGGAAKVGEAKPPAAKQATEKRTLVGMGNEVAEALKAARVAPDAQAPPSSTPIEPPTMRLPDKQRSPVRAEVIAPVADRAPPPPATRADERRSAPSLDKIEPREIQEEETNHWKPTAAALGATEVGADDVELDPAASMSADDTEVGPLLPMEPRVVPPFPGRDAPAAGAPGPLSAAPPVTPLRPLPDTGRDGPGEPTGARALEHALPELSSEVHQEALAAPPRPAAPEATPWAPGLQTGPGTEASETTSPAKRFAVVESSQPAGRARPAPLWGLGLVAALLVGAAVFVGLRTGLIDRLRGGERQGAPTGSGAATIGTPPHLPRTSASVSARPPPSAAPAPSGGAMPPDAVAPAAVASATAAPTASATAAPTASVAPTAGPAPVTSVAPTGNAAPGGAAPGASAASASASAPPSASAAPSTPSPVVPPPSPAASSSAPSAEAAGLQETRGLLTIASSRPARVFVNGVYAGTTGVPLEVFCGPRYVRLGSTIQDPKLDTVWASEGRSIVVPCRGTMTLPLEATR